MFQQPLDFRDESEALYQVLATLSDARGPSQIDRLGSQAIYALIPIPGPRSGFSSEAEKQQLLSLAAESGFIVIDLSDAPDCEMIRATAVVRLTPWPSEKTDGGRLVIGLPNWRMNS